MSLFMSGRTIAIGDIHGCAAALEALLSRLVPQTEDTIVTLGDYVDRGPASREVVECLLQLREQCEVVSLFGNHEQMLLAAIEFDDVDFWMQCGGDTTLLSYGGELAAIPESHVEFFERCHLAYETDSHIFVHANYNADQPINDQDDHILLWKHLGPQFPGPHFSGKTVVVGHTPQTSGEILDAGHFVCIDTWCFGDGWLTAFDVEKKTIWQANKAGEIRQRD